MFATPTTDVKPKMIDLDKILIMEELQQRHNGVDQAVVEEYAGKIAEGAKFPPVRLISDGSTYWMLDGNHRYEAYRFLKRTQIPAIVESGTLEDAIWLSTSVNNDHGIRRTRWDLQNAVAAAIKHPRSKGMSAREISRHVGCDHKTVIAVWDKLRYAGENPHAPPPARPDWLDQIKLNKWYPINPKKKLLFNLPSKSYDSSPIWGQNPSEMTGQHGEVIDRTPEIWEYEFVAEAPPPGMVVFWIADIDPAKSYIVDTEKLFIYEIALPVYTYFKRPAPHIETLSGNRIVHYPWLYEKHLLITFEKPFGDEYQIMVDLLVAAGNTIAKPLPPAELTPQQPADVPSVESAPEPETEEDSESESFDDNDQVALDENEDRLTQAVYDDVDAALESFGDLLAAICKTHALTIEDMTAALDTYSMEDVVIDALQRAKQVA